MPVSRRIPVPSAAENRVRMFGPVVNRKIAVSAAIFSSFTVLLCLFTLGQFVLFLSSHTSLGSFHESTSHEDSVFIPFMQNVFLFGVFGLQHSLQAKFRVKEFLHSRGLEVFERLLYNCGSCLVLQILMYFWKSIPGKSAWEISTQESALWWWFFTTIHVIAWLFTYGICFVMDTPELLGIKQVYYYIQGHPDPRHRKSENLNRLYSHYRHPSFTFLVVILFVHPVMQFDRLTLAYMVTIYMIFAFKLDDYDYAYQLRMYKKKVRELSQGTR